jgi:hypothetical protein
LVLVEQQVLPVGSPGAMVVYLLNAQAALNPLPQLPGQPMVISPVGSPGVGPQFIMGGNLGRFGPSSFIPSTITQPVMLRGLFDPNQPLFRAGLPPGIPMIRPYPVAPPRAFAGLPWQPGFGQPFFGQPGFARMGPELPLRPEVPGAVAGFQMPLGDPARVPVGLMPDPNMIPGGQGEVLGIAAPGPGAETALLVAESGAQGLPDPLLRLTEVQGTGAPAQSLPIVSALPVTGAPVGGPPWPAVLALLSGLGLWLFSFRGRRSS